ncbi:hypothetical protein FRC10_000145 [Ceratobasidium sp. 414]|nr:hypothetical protein FRC10_000145 [Ceratobasidium sp. 414]
MKLFTTLAVVAAVATQVVAHYRWTNLIVNGVKTGDYVNVRQNTNYNSPVTDVSSTDLTCNAGGRSAGATQTATVAAGSTIGFALDQAIYHVGVLNVYMAKAPSTAASFDGSGNVWFKIYQISAVTDGGKTITWPTDNITQVTFKIPSTIPAGEYLVRVEHIALHVKVTGGGSKTPSPLVALPGYYTGQEPGIKINVYYPIPTTYVQPGPAVYTG